MNKDQLVSKLAEESDASKKAASSILDSIVKVIHELLQKGEASALTDSELSL